MSHFARFVKPGSVRLGSSVNSRADVLISAYKNGTKKIVVAINTGANNVTQKISIQDAVLTQVIPYVTTGSKNVEQGAVINVSGNTFSYLLPANSITTFEEQ